MNRQGPLAEDMRFTVDIIDTWNMTITPVAELFETKRKDDYDFIAKDGRSFALLSRPCQAIPIRRIGPPPTAAGSAETEP